MLILLSSRVGQAEGAGLVLAVGEPPRVGGGEIGVEALPDLQTSYALVGNRECGCQRGDRDGQ